MISFLRLRFLLLFLLASSAAVREAPDENYEKAIQLHGKAAPAEVFSLFARSAEAGNPISQYNVAMMYANGEGVFVDYQQAGYWFRKSADQRFAPAQFRLGEMHLFGIGGLDRNPDRAASLFRAAAEKGDSDAQMNLAMLIGSPGNERYDPAKALYWCRKAMDGGHVRAVKYVVILEQESAAGFSVEQQEAYWDRQKYYWIERAAAMGVREAREARSSGS
jgi:TPR repeat protein